MNKSIWKFELLTTTEQYVEMPKNAEILKVQVQEKMLLMH